MVQLSTIRNKLITILIISVYPLEKLFTLFPSVSMLINLSQSVMIVMYSSIRRYASTSFAVLTDMILDEVVECLHDLSKVWNERTVKVTKLHKAPDLLETCWLWTVMTTSVLTRPM